MDEPIIMKRQENCNGLTIQEKSDSTESKAGRIAIVGVACKFPDADNYDEYWNNLIEGKQSIREIEKNRWDPEQYYDVSKDAENKSISKWCGQIKGLYEFDNDFFDISRKEASDMDPKQRILLQETWHCIEDSGISLKELQDKTTSVYVGTIETDAHDEALSLESEVGRYTLTGSHESILANRISCYYNFSGMSTVTNVNCASSGYAMHMAKKALQDGECDYAIVAGTNLCMAPSTQVGFSKEGLLSTDSYMKALDASADGFIRGEGIGVLLLVKEERAKKDNCTIRGVILGSAANHSGDTGLLIAPKVEGQVKVNEEALKNAGIPTDTITYAEFHGTGTFMGDSVEFEAMQQVFSKSVDKLGYCGVGAVGNNIGNLEAASVMAGVIKVLLMFQKHQIPPIIHLQQINPLIDIEHSPFYLPKEIREWDRTKNSTPRRAIVNCYGMGGANCSIILEEPPVKTSNETCQSEKFPFMISAKTEYSLLALQQQWKTSIQQEDELCIKDICYTLMHGRNPFKYRIGGMVKNKEDIMVLLNQKVSKEEIKNGLYLHNVIWNGFNELNFFAKSSLFRKQAEECLSQLKLKYCDLEREFYKLEWKSEKKVLLSFVANYAITRSLLILNKDLRQIKGERTGYYVAMAVSGASSVTDAADGVLKELELEGVAPNISYYSLKKNCWIYSADNLFGQDIETRVNDFLSCLQDAAIDNMYEKCIEKYQVLVNKQAVFAKALQEWNHVLDEVSCPFLSSYIDAKTQNKQERLVVVLSIVESLSQLAKKLNISILSQMIEEDLLKKLSVLQDPFMKKAVIIKLLVPNLWEKVKEEYVLLKSQQDQIMEQCAYVELTQENRMQLSELLLNDWVNGADIQWYLYEDEVPYNKMALPTYCFERTVFEERKKKWKGASFSESGEEEHTKPESTKEEQSEQKGQVQAGLIEIFAGITGMPKKDISEDLDFRELKFDSVTNMELARKLQSKFQIPFEPAMLYGFQTIQELEEYITKSRGEKTGEDRVVRTQKATTTDREAGKEENEIAVIGLSGRFPDSSNVYELWNNLVDKANLIREIPKDRWDWEKYYGDSQEEENKTNIKWGGFLPDIYGFDAAFFRISPMEAELMDPQQRLLLEESYHAIEDAGYKPSDLAGSDTGVFIGICNNDYEDQMTKNGVNMIAHTATGTSFAVAANRISYFFDFHGPSLATDTACASSLTSVYQAVRALQAGDCNMALAGGVNVICSPKRYLAYGQGGMLSEDGQCKTFDNSANGYVRGEGVGVIVLKRLSDAKRDGDTILGTIKGIEINHGGYVSSITVPNPNAQSNLIEKTIERSNIPVETITYLETHGTGTKIGDPIEINGLKQAFTQRMMKEGKDSLKEGFCTLGAIKTSIGHLESAAGIAGMIKVLLCLRNKKIPPIRNFNQLNQSILLEGEPFQLATELADWCPKDESGKPIVRRAGVSSFGFGGANAHAILEEYVEDTCCKEQETPQIIVLSARKEATLREYAGNIYQYIKGLWKEPRADKEIQQQVKKIFAEALHVLEDEIWLDSEYEEFGCHEFVLSTVLEQLNETFEQKDSIELFQRCRTIHELIDYLQKKCDTKAPKNTWQFGGTLENIAYTLQVSREDMECRAGFVANSMEDLLDKLYALSQNETCSEISMNTLKRIGRNRKKNYKDIPEGTTKEEIIKEWLSGTAIDFSKFHDNVHKIYLPGYPFEKKKYCLEFQDSKIEAPEIAKEDTEVHLYQPVLVPKDSSKINQNADSEILLIANSYQKEDALVTGLELACKKNGHVKWFDSLESLQDCISGRRKNKDITIAVWLRGLEIEETENWKKELLWMQELIQILEKVYNNYSVLFAVSGKVSFAKAINAYANSLQSVLPSLRWKTVLLDNKMEIVDQVLEEEKEGWDQHLVFRRRGKRFVREWKELQPIENNQDILKRNMTVFITGGCGGLGRIFAEYFAQKWKANLVLAGRKKADQKIEDFLHALEKSGGRASYYSCDVGNETMLENVFTCAKEQYGSLHLVLHTAGIMSKKSVTDQDAKEIEELWNAKIKGTYVLSRLACKEEVEKLILFSSTSAVLGDFGQCSYGMSNAYLDACSSAICKSNYKTKVCAVEWPLWGEGGMHMDNEEFYLKMSNMHYLKKKEGIQVFEEAVRSENETVFVFPGSENAAKKFFTVRKKTDKEYKEYENDMKEKYVEETLVNIASRLLKMEKDEIDVTENMSDFGFDSILMKQMAKELGEQLHCTVSPSVFFSYSSFEKLASHLADKVDEISENELDEELENKDVESDTEKNELPDKKEVKDDEIAVIGMAFQLPGATTQDEFWDNLIKQRSAVTEIPAERWDWKETMGDLNTEGNKTNSKWGAFIQDIDKFDAPFFHITKKEAVLMDPQQRLLLQSVWNLFEDAGYKASELAGSDTGVYIGAQTAEYVEMLQERDIHSGQAFIGNSMAMLANRISYFFDFHGESETIETACSSSMVATSHAVKALKNKEIGMAVVGGVNLAVTNSSYINVAQLGVFSKDGACKTFDKSANGYVKGEGIVTLLLKTHQKAVEDGDHIYGLIKACEVGHGGKANSITAPNAEAQANLIYRAMQKANVTPETIQYIEAHGTGTELGDAVEIQGLRKAFEKFDANEVKENSCGVGSLKTNIGHLEPAAGVASIIKVLLSMNHHKIPGLCNFKELNPYLELDDSPFYIAIDNQPWNQLQAESGETVPRRAGISAFGFGGTNAHMILEEAPAKQSVENQESQMIILSAKKEEILQEYIKIVANYMKLHTSLNLADVAYTLQVGREEWDYRFAIVADTTEELVRKLEAYLAGESMDGVFQGTKSTEEKVDGIMANGIEEVAKKWVTGASVEWKTMWSGKQVNRVSLPGYPFEKKRYWINDEQDTQKKPVIVQKHTESVAEKQDSSKKTTLIQTWQQNVTEYNGKAVKFDVVEGSIAMITMQDIENRNMFTEDVVRGLLYYFNQINQSETIKAVIVTGDNGIFAMGGTKQTLINIANRDEQCSDATFGYECMLQCKVPVIAAMQGHAFGGGFTFGLFADIVIASLDASYSVNFMQYGFTPGVGTTYIVKEKLGAQLANEMMFTANLYSGQELKERGASILFEKSSEVVKKALQIAKSVSAKPIVSLKVLKEELSGRTWKELPGVIDGERKMQQITFSQLSAMDLINKNFSHSEPAKKEEVKLQVKTKLKTSADVEKVEAKPEAKPEAKSTGKIQLVRKQVSKPEAPKVEAPRPEVSKPTAPKIEVKKVQHHTEESKPSNSKNLTSYASARVDMQEKKKEGIQIVDQAMFQRIKEKLTELVERVIGEDSIDVNYTFSELGIDSISGIELIREINAYFHIDLSTVAIYDYPSIEEMSKYVYSVSDTAQEMQSVSDNQMEYSDSQLGQTQEEQSTLDDSMDKILEQLYHDQMDLETANQRIFHQ